jgi:flagellin-like protein
LKKIWKDENAVSPVIAVILMVAITVVLAAVLYVMVSGMLTTTSTTPTAGLTKEPGATAGEYRLNIVSPSKSVTLTDITLTLWDNSDSIPASGDLTTGSSTSVTCGSGKLNATYYDTGTDDKMDGADIIKIYNAYTGDTVKLVYKPTGGVICEVAI